MQNPTSDPISSEAASSDATSTPADDAAATKPPVTADTAHVDGLGHGSENTELETKVVDIMKTVFDPEIPVNIYDLGMVYKVDARNDGNVFVNMTLTSPSCPVAGSLPGEVETKIKTVAGVTAAKLDLVWEPAWTPDRMTEASKLQLGMM